ncbi:2-iminoacetate synthase ThiH [Tepidibacter thalassicus]|uniref:Tyrosine lyase ThiH n=1 Tax=Tepidibacter thalassicus DSM 15285 TaxID=1123350 RepID=A0A1M5RCX8_9FIRM|nr:2-iminoacetate synthase ThiH [Tepidibacter thalassicus]SHH24131.1 tyrosine lyase ThiH [Tepidibacter thalassicus DSM 15285]
MSFYDEYVKYKHFDFDNYFKNITDIDILNVISKNRLNEFDFLTLLSPTAENYLEEMAQKSNKLSIQHFGKSIILYTPMYISNYCSNKCSYCSFNVENKISRKKLTLEEIEIEAKKISSTGLRHILILTGESKSQTPISYIKDCIYILKNYFDSICIEIYPLTEKEYLELVNAGVDSLTIYQEVYNETIYDKVHVSGPKKNYKFRLDAPERGCRAKMRSVNIGALLGLYDFRSEAFFTGLHGYYLQNKYLDVEISFSLPRIRPHIGNFADIYEVTDKNLVQVMLALKLFMPYAGINISTRESKEFRENLIPLGITKMSAGVCTSVGGHSQVNKSSNQFEIADTRSVSEIKNSLLKKGYQPIFKDWDHI